MVITTEGKKVEKVSFLKLYAAGLCPALTLSLPVAGSLLLIYSLLGAFVWLVAIVCIGAGAGISLVTLALPSSEYEARLKAVKRLGKFNPFSILILFPLQTIYHAVRYRTLRLRLPV